MSRILRRPMFRGGGPVNSYGTGIAAPLVPGYQGGGQIGGGIVYGIPHSDGRFGFQKPILNLDMMPNSNVTSGLELLKKNKAIQEGNVPMIPVNVAGVKDEKQDQTTDGGKSQVIEDVDFSGLNSDFDQTKTVTLDDGRTVQVTVPAEEVAPSADIKFMLGMIDYDQLKEERKQENLELENEKDRIEKINRGPIDTSGNDLPPSLRNQLEYNPEDDFKKEQN
jgi:hypothetical protein